MINNERPAVGSKIELDENSSILNFLETLKIELSANELDYWHDNPPQAVILATASARKGYISHLWGNGYDFASIPPFLDDVDMERVGDLSIGETNPLAFQGLVEEKIRNGDGTLKRPSILFLGYFMGVPVILEPQTGETHDNSSARDQSRLKIESVQNLDRYKGLDVIVVASDTVGSTQLNGFAEEKMGKPRNHEEFPVKADDESQSQFQARVELFNLWYILRYFTAIQVEEKFDDWFTSVEGSVDNAKDQVIEKVVAIFESSETQDFLNPITERHHNAVVARRGDKEELVETELFHQLNQAEQLLLATFAVNGDQIFGESAGGGSFQKRFPLHETGDQLLESVSNDELRKYLEAHDPEIRPWILLFHIMGVPVWCHTILRKLSEKVKLT